MRGEAGLEARPKTRPDLWAPCTPSPHPTKSAPHYPTPENPHPTTAILRGPRYRDFVGTPGPALPPAVLSHALEGAPSAPRRRHQTWGTWDSNLSARFPAAPLGPFGVPAPSRPPVVVPPGGED